MINFGNVPASAVLYIPFATFNSSGASVTLTGLAVTDIEIYKDGSVTQRASDAGYTLLDTDGIDFDGITGIHGFSVNLGDNTDAGFYAVGSSYFVVVSAVTVDSQTVNFIAATFRIIVAENTAGTPVVDVGRISNDATAADNLEALLDGTLTGPYAAFGILESGTAQSATATTLVGRAAGAVADDAFNGCVLLALGSTQGYWQAAAITDTTLSSDTFTIVSWPSATPSGTITYVVIGVPNSSAVPLSVDIVSVNNSTTAADNLANFFTGTGYNAASSTVGVVTAVTNANVQTINNTTVLGAGTSGNLWRGS